MSSVGQLGMSSSRVTDSPVCVILHKTPLLVSPAAVPHPQPPPVDDRTVASAIQFAPFRDVVGVLGCGVGVGVVVACVGERTSEHAVRSRTAVSVRCNDFMVSLPDQWQLAAYSMMLDASAFRATRKTCPDTASAPRRWLQRRSSIADRPPPSSSTLQRPSIRLDPCGQIFGDVFRGVAPRSTFATGGTF